MAAPVIAFRPPIADRRTRLAWFGAAVFVILFGIGEFGRWIIDDLQGTPWWGTDLQLIVGAGVRLVAGQSPYVEPRFLYPPLAAIVGIPAGAVPFILLSVGYAAAKAALAFACVAFVLRPTSRPVRAAAAVTVICCLPFLHDVMLGNANVLLVASMVPAVYGTDRRRDGIALGVVMAVFAKPLIVPVLIWLLIWRPRALLGSVVTAAACTVAAAVVVGPSLYLAWFETLVGGTRYAAPFAGNHGVSALFPDAWVPIAVVALVGSLVVMVRREPIVGLAWAAAAGLLISPYAGTYSALPIVLALPGVAMLAPWMAIAISAASPLATTHPLPIYAAIILIASLGLRESGRIRSAHEGMTAIPIGGREARSPAP